jgi:hypothetical protein
MSSTEKDIDEQEYLDGFNLGYKLTKYSPEIAELLPPNNGSDKLLGMNDGRKQFYMDIELNKDKDLSIDQYNSDKPVWLSDNRLEDLDKEIDLDSDIEPDNDPDI